MLDSYPSAEEFGGCCEVVWEVLSLGWEEWWCCSVILGEYCGRSLDRVE
jgi:hypothetical protein